MYNGSSYNDKANNEVVMSNLIRVATNERLFQMLDPETQYQLLNAIALYTKGSVEEIYMGQTEDSNYINSHKLR